jgi:hypothetical protein
MKSASLRSSILPMGILLCLASGCTPQTPQDTGPTPREKELMQTVTELRAKLAAAEQEIQLAKAAAQTATQVALDPTPAEKATGTGTSQPETRITDTSYIVVKKTFVAGKLISKKTGANPNATERQAADCRVTFKGVPSGTVYPELEINELAFGRFREGAAYSPQDIIQSKKSAPKKSGTAHATSSDAQQLSSAEARAIFGD